MQHLPAIYVYSAALCRGLIEAGSGRPEEGTIVKVVFRGFMPRPH